MTRFYIDESLLVLRSKDFDLPKDDSSFLAHQMNAFNEVNDGNNIAIWKKDATYFERVEHFAYATMEREHVALKKELYYGVAFSIEDMPHFQDSTSDCAFKSSMHLPPKNPYIPRELLLDLNRYNAGGLLDGEMVRSSPIIPVKLHFNTATIWSSLSKISPQPKFVSYFLFPTNETGKL